jgi:hypothetical protein
MAVLEVDPYDVLQSNDQLAKFADEVLRLLNAPGNEARSYFDSLMGDAKLDAEARPLDLAGYALCIATGLFAGILIMVILEATKWYWPI